MIESPRVGFRRVAALFLTFLLVAGFGFASLISVAPAASATPWSGPEPTPTHLQFCLHNSSTRVTVGSGHYLDVLSTVNDTQAPWTATGANTIGLHYDRVQFVVAPQLASALVLNGTIDATVYMNQSGSSLSGGSISVSIDQVAPSGALTLIANGPSTGTGAIASVGSVPGPVFLTGPTINGWTVPAADTLQLNISISGNTATGYGIWWGSVQRTYYLSTISIPVSSYLSVSPVAVLNSTGQPETILSTTTANQTVTIRGNVSDPLGAYDFENFSVDFSVVSAAGSTVVPPTPMQPVGGRPAPGAANGTYQIAFNYSALAAGSYNFTVNATDNTNHNLAAQNTLPAYFGRNAIGQVTVSVGLPPVPVRLTVVDDHGAPLIRASVRALSAGVEVASGRTNLSGQFVFRLAGGTNYQFAVSWEGVGVGVFTVAVNATSTSAVLHAFVVYPRFTIVSADGTPIPFPLVTVIHPNGTAYPLIVANSSGSFSLSQVPVGNYTLTVVYDDSEVVFAKSVSVSSDGPIEVSALNVFPLTVQAHTAGGGALSEVFVTLVNSITGSVVASGITGGTGTLTFLVPAGSYIVTGTWASTYDLTDLRQTASTNVTVTAPAGATLTFSSAFPSFYSTTLFDVVLGYGLLLVVALALGVLWLRARSRGAASVPPAKRWNAGARSGESTRTKSEPRENLSAPAYAEEPGPRSPPSG
jgi:hypothetical protein